MASIYTKAIIGNAITVSAVESKDIVNKAIKIHKLSPVAAVALGRALTMACLMGKEMKNTDDYLSATIDGGGPLGKITVCADSLGNVKGGRNQPRLRNSAQARRNFGRRRGSGGATAL